MMHTFVGFLRLANFICAATVLFGLVTEKLITLELAKDNPSLLNGISKIHAFKEVKVLFKKDKLFKVYFKLFCQYSR